MGDWLDIWRRALYLCGYMYNIDEVNADDDGKDIGEGMDRYSG